MIRHGAGDSHLQAVNVAAKMAAKFGGLRRNSFIFKTYVNEDGVPCPPLSATYATAYGGFFHALARHRGGVPVVRELVVVLSIVQRRAILRRPALFASFSGSRF